MSTFLLISFLCLVKVVVVVGRVVRAKRRAWSRCHAMRGKTSDFGTMLLHSRVVHRSMRKVFGLGTCSYFKKENGVVPSLVVSNCEKKLRLF